MPQTILGAARALSVLAAGAALAACAPQAADAAPKAKGSAASRTAPKAELITKGLVLDFAGDALTVQARIANTGARRAGRSDVIVALSSDAVLDEDDEFLDEIGIKSVKPRGDRGIATEVEIPEELPDGDLYLLVCADGNEAVSERREDDNCAAEKIASAGDETDPDETPGDDDSSSTDDDGETADLPVTIEQ